MMPAGEYYVGDLCYVMTDKEWTEVCQLTISGNACIEGEFQLKDGRRFAMYGTRWGDGGYYDNATYSEYSVDSGTIGCILKSDIKANNYENIESLGAFITFDNDFVTSGGRSDRNWDGNIQFGNIFIETDPPCEEEEEEEYDY